MSQAITGDGLLKAQPPRPALSIGKEKVLTAIAVIGILLTISILISKRNNVPKAPESSDQTGQPGYHVSTLPSSYSELPVPTAIAAPRIELLEKDDSTSKLDALLAKLAEERLRRSGEAQKSSVSFQNFQIPKQENAFGSISDESETNSIDPQTINPRDESNRQDEKLGFLSKKRESDVYLNHRLTSPRSPNQLMAGTLIPGLMLTGLNSDLPGQILGQVSQNVFDTVTGSRLLVPQGTKVLGQYDSRIVYGQERVLIVWTRIIFPNGKSLSLEGMPGVDLSGYAGLSDQVNNHWGRLLTGVLFSSLLSAGAQVAEGRNYTTQDPSYAELAGQGVAKNANDVGQEITRKNLNIQPTLEIRPGFRFNVFVHKDMILEPYKD